MAYPTAYRSNPYNKSVGLGFGSGFQDPSPKGYLATPGTMPATSPLGTPSTGPVTRMHRPGAGPSQPGRPSVYRTAPGQAKNLAEIPTTPATPQELARQLFPIANALWELHQWIMQYQSAILTAKYSHPAGAVRLEKCPNTPVVHGPHRHAGPVCGTESHMSLTDWNNVPSYTVAGNGTLNWSYLWPTGEFTGTGRPWHKRAERWFAPAGSAAPDSIIRPEGQGPTWLQPAPAPGGAPAPLVNAVFPAVDPLAKPILVVPLLPPQPVPFRLLPALREAHKAAASVRVDTTTRGEPARSVGPRAGPAPVPTLIAEVSPNGARLIRTRTPVRLAFSRRPGAERKHVVRQIYGAAVEAWDFVGEVQDFLESIHDALPPQCQVRSSSPQAMAGAIVSCFDGLDMNQAVMNLFANAIEDAVIGNANRLAAHPGSRGRGGPNLGVGPAL